MVGVKKGKEYVVGSRQGGDGVGGVMWRAG